MSAVDLALTYAFVRRLAQPFKEWPAFKSGVIDEAGAILVPPDKRTPEQAKSFGYFDVVTRNLKRLLETIPGGKSPVVSMAAALVLLREHEAPRGDLRQALAAAIPISASMPDLYEEIAAGPTNTAGGGAVAGLDGKHLPPRKQWRTQRAADITRKRRRLAEGEVVDVRVLDGGYLTCEAELTVEQAVGQLLSRLDRALSETRRDEPRSAAPFRRASRLNEISGDAQGTNQIYAKAAAIAGSEAHKAIKSALEKRRRRRQMTSTMSPAEKRKWLDNERASDRKEAAERKKALKKWAKDEWNFTKSDTKVQARQAVAGVIGHDNEKKLARHARFYHRVGRQWLKKKTKEFNRTSRQHPMLGKVKKFATSMKTAVQKTWNKVRPALQSPETAVRRGARFVKRAVVGHMMRRPKGAQPSPTATPRPEPVKQPPNSETPKPTRRRAVTTTPVRRKMTGLLPAEKSKRTKPAKPRMKNLSAVPT